MIAFYLPGGVPVYTFALLLGLSGTLGLSWVALGAPEKKLNRYLNAGLILLLGGLVGGRAVYLALHWPYYQTYSSEILASYSGGLSWIGAALGALVSLVLYALIRRERLGVLLDGLFPMAALIVVGGWMACWLDGYAYGAPSSAWWAVPARDEWNLLTPRVPVQPLGALLSLGTLWLVDRLGARLSQRKQPNSRGPAVQPGLVAAFGTFCLALEVFLLSFLRADPSPVWQGLRLDAWAALAFTLLAGFACLYLYLGMSSSEPSP